MKGEKLDAALQESKSAARVDAVQDLMRAAIIRSSICKFNGTPYYFSGRIYEEMAWDDFGNLIYDLMRKCKMPNGDYSRVEGVLKVCKRVVAGKALKPDNAIVVFNNCVFDMSARRAHPFNSRWVQTTCVPYDYKPEEHVFLWRMFLDEVLPDKNMQKFCRSFLEVFLLTGVWRKWKLCLFFVAPAPMAKAWSLKRSWAYLAGRMSAISA